jgi:hypothetical protein
MFQFVFQFVKKMIQEIYDNYVNPQHATAFSSPGNLKRIYQNRFGTKPINESLKHIDSYVTHREYKKPRVTNSFFLYRKRQQVCCNSALAKDAMHFLTS